MFCLNCKCNIDDRIMQYSVKKYAISLCIDCQRWIDSMSKFCTVECIRLYFALRDRNVPAQLEKFDGYKHIDIAIPQAKINIEVDGMHHNFNAKQALTDLKRTYYSFLKGYFTLRIPNSLLRDDDSLQETADWIAAFLNEQNNK